MLILVNNPPFPATPLGLVDDIQIITEAAFAIAANAGVTWYCSWNGNQGCSSSPFRNNGAAPAAATAAFTLSAPTSLVSATIPPALIPPQTFEITEITITNILNAATGGPVAIFIVFFNGATGFSNTILRTSLALGHTLSYKAAPGTNGVWQLFDNHAQIVNS